MAGPATTEEHWSLYLLDTYIIYNVLYLAVLIGVSMSSPDRLNYWKYKFLPFKTDFNQFREHKKWWEGEQAKIITNANQSGGGKSKYSLKIWIIVLIWSVFLFIMAVLFPSRTKEHFSNVTMPTMFKDSILDTGKSDSDKLGFLFRHVWSDSSKDKYTVQPNDIEDIKFIRETDERFRESNSILDDEIIIKKENFKVREGFTEFKTVCGSTNDATKQLDILDQYRCKDGLNMKGEKCHNNSKSPCCQRYCPSDSGYGTYHPGNNQGGSPIHLNRPPLNQTSPNWQCNTVSEWDAATNKCMHIVAEIPTDKVYMPVMSNDSVQTGSIIQTHTPQVSNGGNLTGTIQI
jgi:hypothetical protein